MAWSIAPAGRHRLAHALTAVLLAAGAATGVATLGAAPAYAATPGNVCQPGKTMITWSRISKPWAVELASEVANQQPGTLKESTTETVKEVIRASAEADAGASISENTLIEQLQAHVHLKLAVAGSHTTTKTVTITVTLAPFTTVIFYHAAHVVQGTYTHWRCGAGGYKNIGHGTAHSWYIQADGAVNCPGSRGYRKPKAGTPGAAAQVFC
jgi:hypothetical protein